MVPFSPQRKLTCRKNIHWLKKWKSMLQNLPTQKNGFDKKNYLLFWRAVKIKGWYDVRLLWKLSTSLFSIYRSLPQCTTTSSLFETCKHANICVNLALLDICLNSNHTTHPYVISIQVWLITWIFWPFKILFLISLRANCALSRLLKKIRALPRSLSMTMLDTGP